MPSFEDIERFTRTLTTLGNEPQILQERGEALELPERPEQGLSSDLTELLGDTLAESGGELDLDSMLDTGDEEAVDESGGSFGGDILSELGFEPIPETEEEISLEDGSIPETDLSAEEEFVPSAPEDFSPPAEEPESPPSVDEFTVEETQEEAPEEDFSTAELGDMAGLFEEATESSGFDEADDLQEESLEPFPGFTADEFGAETFEVPDEIGEPEETVDESGEESVSFDDLQFDEPPEDFSSFDDSEGAPDVGEEASIEEAADITEDISFPESGVFQESETDLSAGDSSGAGEEDFSFDSDEFSFEAPEEFETTEEDIETPAGPDIDAELESLEGGTEAPPVDEFSTDDFSSEVEKNGAEGFESDDFQIPDEAAEEVPEVPSEEGQEGPPESFDFDESDFSFDDSEDSFDLSLDESSERSDETKGEEDEFSFDGGEEFEPPVTEGSEDFEAGGEELFDLGDDEALEGFGEAGDEDFSVDEFSLGDFGAEFGVMDDSADLEEMPEEGDEEDLNPAMAVTGEAPETFQAADEEFSLEDKEFEQAKKTLSILPRNLKIEVESAISAGEIQGDPLYKLIQMLVAGESARAIGQYTGKLVGKRIQIPAGYEKRTGAEYELEKGSFAYAFRENILPILRVVILSAAALGVVAWLSYQFIYRPIFAGILYARGYEDVQEDRYEQGNRTFDRAFELWQRKNWFYEYAELFRGKKQYFYARDKYDQLLFYYPFDKKASLDYAEMETQDLAEYKKADEILTSYLDNEDHLDFDVLLAQGDNYIEWADNGNRTVFEKFDSARKSYAFLIENNGNLDELLFRMLSMFVREEIKAREEFNIPIDNLDHVLFLKNHFRNNPNTDIDPNRYAELGGYLIDREGSPQVDLGEVKDILFDGLEVDQLVPELHYHLARYFRKINVPLEEEKALDNVLSLLDGRGPYHRKRMALLVDSYKRKGEVEFNREEYITAEDLFLRGADLYETGLDAKKLRQEARFGEIYSHLGDIYYYQSGEWQDALALYEKAEANNFYAPANAYKKGVIHYSERNYDNALEEFSEALEVYRQNKNLLFAAANTLYNRGTYGAAEGYYTRLLDKLEKDYINIPILRVYEKPEDRALVDFIIKTRNNLGVTLYKESGGREGSSDYSSALVELSTSSELFANLHRDEDSRERSGIKDLASLNTRDILYPQEGFEPQIYMNLPRDLGEIKF